MCVVSISLIVFTIIVVMFIIYTTTKACIYIEKFGNCGKKN